MSLSPTLKRYLENSGVAFEITHHPHAVVSSHVAQLAHVSGDRLAKGVVIKSDHGYLLALVPASRHVDLASLSHLTGDRLGLAGEDEIQRLFPDCETGAVPACGEAFGLRCMIDDSLIEADEVYFEGGDHESLIHLKGADFARLMPNAPHGPISTAH